MNAKPKRSASLTFRGFQLSPEDVENLVGTRAALLAQSGQQMKPGSPNVWPRSAAMFQVELADDALIADMVPAVLEHVGGLEHLCAVRDQVLPEFLEINLVLPIKFSEAQEDGYVEIETLRALAYLGATLGLSFL